MGRREGRGGGRGRGIISRRVAPAVALSLSLDVLTIVQ